MQSILQLMGEKEMFEYWSQTYRVHNLDWSQEKAALILDAWQRKFTQVSDFDSIFFHENSVNISQFCVMEQEVMRHAATSNDTKNYKIHPFSSASLADILTQFSELSITRVALGYILMLVYAAVSLVNWVNPVRSQSGLGVAGVLLVAITVAAGLGFCALIGIAFNASTTQIVPFLALGLGVDNMFLLTHTYGQSFDADIPADQHIGEILKRSGVSILLSSLSNACAFFAAAIIPIPALRAFSLQAGILVLFNMAALLLVFPAIMSLDTKRRKSNRVDLLCCLAGSDSSAGDQTPSGASKTSSVECPNEKNRKSRHPTLIRAAPAGSVTPTLVKKNVNASADTLAVKDAESADPVAHDPLLSDSSAVECRTWTLTKFARHSYSYVLMKTPVKVTHSFAFSIFRKMFQELIKRFTLQVLGVVAYIVVMGASLWFASKVKNGLNLTDIVPHQTAEYGFLSAHDKYFGFYNMYAVTQGNFEYPNNQRLLYEYHDAFMRVSKIIKNDDGGLPEFWLSLFRDWLIGLQKAFDRDYAAGCINQERWYNNASDDGILAYKLLVQTGQFHF